MEVYKNPNLGFSIAGGIDSGSNPFHPNDNKVSEKWRLSILRLNTRMHYTKTEHFGLNSTPVRLGTVSVSLS